MEQYKIDITLIILILLLLISISYLIFTYDKDGYSCLANPINYFEEKNNADCICRKQQGDFNSDIKINISKIKT